MRRQTTRQSIPTMPPACTICRSPAQWLPPRFFPSRRGTMYWTSAQPPEARPQNWAQRRVCWLPMISAIPVRKPCSEILNCAASPTRLSPMKYPHHWLKPCRNSLIRSWSTLPVPGRECSEKNLRLQKHGMRTDPTSLQSCSGNVSLPPFPC